ncbi:(deoxy)nucleoside triphosphate pyrophosphohydrolase [Atopobium sp. oral taxon 199]|uniref:(deoxy)nucleoside triphosphate pyrophosphohydrolase n=1 Tax=Atopobium sp. oral taxon 199 TaxID=712156 RepID=UPI00034E26B8|nr:NUDIX domain-containing protein [Atopobium sp. oral taxon 199]EPD77951.1 7,8-dihydro-8-oxoguanine triphosphatase [Atopobium sp. oral taxon 199 str. F0494]
MTEKNNASGRPATSAKHAKPVTSTTSAKPTTSGTSAKPTKPTASATSAKPAKHVVAAIIYRDNTILAACRSEDQDQGGLWEFAGGKIEAGESPETALRREIREELGAELQLILPYDTVDYNYPEFHLCMEVFICTLAPGEEPRKLIHSELRWLSPSELLDVAWLPADRDLVMTLGTLWDDIFESQHL